MKISSKVTVLSVDEVKAIKAKPKRERNGRAGDAELTADILAMFDRSEIAAGMRLTEIPTGIYDYNRYIIKFNMRGPSKGEPKLNAKGETMRVDKLRTVRGNLMAAFAKLDETRKSANFTNGGTFKDCLFHWGKESESDEGEILLEIRLDERTKREKKNKTLPMLSNEQRAEKAEVEQKAVTSAGKRNGK